LSGDRAVSDIGAALDANMRKQNLKL